MNYYSPDYISPTQGPRILVIAEDDMIRQVLQVRLDAYYGAEFGRAAVTHYAKISDALDGAFRKQYQVIILAPTLDDTDLDTQNSRGEALLGKIRSGHFGEPATSTPVVLVCGVSGVSHESFRVDPLTRIVDTIHPHESHAGATELPGRPGLRTVYHS